MNRVHMCVGGGLNALDGFCVKIQLSNLQISWRISTVSFLALIAAELESHFII